MKSALRALGLLLVVGMLALAWMFFSTREQLPTASAPVTPPASPTKDESSPAPSIGARWNHADQSVEQNGAGFFDRARRESFSAKVTPADRPYVIELNSRAFLPDAGEQAAESILGTDNNTPITVYLQFAAHRDEERRAELQAAGIELQVYASGHAWVARATPNALRALLKSGEARALAQIDPRDKLAPAVYAQRVPAYAKLDDGRAVYSAIVRKGANDAALKDAVAADGISAQQPSVLGDRYRVLLNPADAEKFAALADVSFMGYGPPPVARRDGKLDESSNVKDVRDAGLQLTGANVKVAVREIGRPLVHQDLNGQIELVEATGASDPSEIRHSSAVSGVVAGKGVTIPAAKGVAPGAKVLSYALNEDPFGPSDIIDAGKRGARISNHSYGPAQIDTFGNYDPISADLDSAARENDLLGFYAGNEEVGGIFKHIDFYSGSKNVICVSATGAVAHAGDDDPATPVTNGIAGFAEHGPMQEGRVKPDLVAFGDMMTLIAGLNESTTSSGTSFSCPGVAGMAALLEQHFNTVVGRRPSAAIAKAILLNTAGDAGQPGPDAKYGFGIANIEAAVGLVSARSSATNSTFVEGISKNGVTTSFNFFVTTNGFVRATLCWMDVAGNPGVVKALINDLDLELVSPSGTTFFPFSLNADSPNAAATASGANSVDNVEQIAINATEAGTWTLRVKGTSVAQGPQPFALVATGGLIKLDTAAALSASPITGPAPLAVSFSTAGSVGTITEFAWDFGDGSTQTGANLAELSHTYSSPGVYVATVTLNGVSSAGVIISVDKTLQTATVKSAKLTLSFKNPPGFEDDQLTFSLKAPGLIESKETVAAKLKSGAYEGVRMFVSIGGGESRAPEPSRVFEVQLDKRAQARSGFNMLKYSPKTGEVKVNARQLSLETTLEADGLTRNTGSAGRYMLPVEVETETSIYRAVVPVDYKVTARSGSAKQAKK